MVYLDETSSFEELLRKDGSVTIHHRNLHSLSIEMFKVFKGIGPVFMKEIFAKHGNNDTENVSSNTRSKSRFYNPSNPKTVNYGLETLRCLGPKIWEIIPIDMRNSTSLSTFKSRIKQWVPHSCLCRLCKVYIPQLGFL